jgi:hypothetical protein
MLSHIEGNKFGDESITQEDLFFFLFPVYFVCNLVLTYLETSRPGILEMKRA